MMWACLSEYVADFTLFVYCEFLNCHGSQCPEPPLWDGLVREWNECRAMDNYRILVGFAGHLSILMCSVQDDCRLDHEYHCIAFRVD